MRIIAGKYKKSTLFSVPGDKTRPTTDFTRELVFSVIHDCEDLSVLDLFAGSGAIGLEALSRGAASATFVDISERSVKTINQNIGKLRCGDQTSVYKKRASAFLKNFESRFDLIFMDPPYDQNLINPTLDLIYAQKTLNRNGLLIIEHSHRELIKKEWLEFSIYQKKTGSCQITILKDLIGQEDINEDL